MSILDRRTFLGSLSLAGAGLFTGAPALSLGGTAETTPVSETPSNAEDWLRHVDDMWGHWPPYAHPIPHGVADAAPLPWDQIQPADRMWTAWA
jgi:hypothetical protein